MHKSMHDSSLEKVIKLIDEIFDYLDKINAEFDKNVYFNETVLKEQTISNYFKLIF
jgi:hypothetical protein